MKREVSVRTIIAVIAMVVVIIGLVAWKVMFAPSGASVDYKTTRIAKDKRDAGSH
jgi:hypothetical protein